MGSEPSKEEKLIKSTINQWIFYIREIKCLPRNIKMCSILEKPRVDFVLNKVKKLATQTEKLLEKNQNQILFEKYIKFQATYKLKFKQKWTNEPWNKFLV